MTVTRPITHGTESGYSYHGCRCEQCRAGRASRARAYNAASPKPRKRRKPTEIKHGTLNAYNNRGCRCEPCRAAGSDYRRKRREANPGRSSEIQRQWREANPEKVSGQQERNRDRKRIIRAEERATMAEEQLAEHLTACMTATAPLAEILEARARTLSMTIARAPRSTAAVEARHRRAEIRDLLARIREVTS